MANDNRRSHKVKDGESIKSKKKMVKQDASPASILRPSDASSSKRSSRETSSKKETKENLSNARKSERLGKRKPSANSERLEKRKPSATPIKEKSERTQEQTTTTSMKSHDRHKKQTSLGSLGSKKFVEEAALSNMKSKKEKVGRSSKQCVMDASEDNRQKKKGLDVGGKKRKRVATCVKKALSKPRRIKTEAGDDNDKESQDKSSQANSSSNRDVDTEQKRPDKLRRLDNSKNEYSGFKSVEDKDDGGDECSDRAGEKSTLKASKGSGLSNLDVEEVNDDFEVKESDLRRKINPAEGHIASRNSIKVEGVPHHVVQEPLNERFMDLEQVGHVGCPSKKSLDGEFIESGKGSSSKREKSKRKTEPATCKTIKDNPISRRSPSSRCKRHGHDETCLACSKKQRTNHGLGKLQELNYCDTTSNKDLYDTSGSKDRMTCEAAGLAEIVGKDNGVSRMGTSICNACKLGGKLRYCDAVGCNRCYHLSCLDLPVNNVPSGNWRCPFCVANIKSSVRVRESIWDTREVEVSGAEGLQKQKEYFVKYKGLAHIHNQWVTETQLLLEAPLLVENFSKNGLMKWTEEWITPHQLLKKRLLLSFKPLYESQQNTGKVLNYHYEWLVKWQGLDYEQATWESENTSVLDSPEGHNLIKEYENHCGNAKISASSDDKIKELLVKLPTIPAGSPSGMDNIHLSYVKKLHDAWIKGHNSLVFDDQERTMRIVLFIFSLKGVTLPFLLITTSSSLPRWEAMFLKIALCTDFKVSLEDTEGQRGSRLLEVQNEGGQLAFQVLLYPVDVLFKDLNVLKAINWEAVIVDESQSSEISAHFSHIKSLSTDKRLLVFCGSIDVSMGSYIDVLSLLDCDGALPSCVVSKTELDDISKLKETLSRFIAYECKSSSSKFVEFWVPVQISNLQLEQYCSMLLSNAMALSSCSKSDTVGALHDILVSNRKCCDHPYIVDQGLQGVLTKDLEPAKFLDVGIKASGKLQFLDLILPEMRKRQLRVLILFQPLSGSGKDSISIGDILDDFVRQRFGEDSYERVDGIGIIPSKKQAALNNFNNKDMGRFIFLLEYRACLSSIKLSSVDTIVIFDSDWNPANDLRALQKIAIDSQLEQIMIFRLYTSWTLEEKILRLAEHNVTIDGKWQNLSRSTSDALLMWGATCLFNKLAEFHSSSVLNISSEECTWNELMEEFLNLISHKCKKDTAKLLITKVQQGYGTNSKNLPLPSEPITQLPDGDKPHTFWRNLLVGRNPSWKFLSRSVPRQRKRPQYFEESPKKTNAGNDDVGRKRKKTANIIIEPVASEPGIEEGEIAGTCTGAPGIPSHNESQSSPGDSFWCDAIRNETSFCCLLKLNISKLCEVLSLSEDVKIMVERFLEYVIENYRVNKEPANTLQAFLISLCWIGCALLKHKLDRRQSVALAKKHLNFSCEEEEANTVYLKLEPAREKFLRHTENHKKTDVSKDPIPAAQGTSMRSLDPRVSHPGQLDPQGVKVEILESPHNQYVDDEIILMEYGGSENCKLLSKETLLCSKQMPSECKKQKEDLAKKKKKEMDKFNREGSANTGTNNVEVDGMVFEVPGARNKEQSKRPCSSSNSANSTEPTSSHTSIKQVVDVAISSVPAEQIPAKKHEGVCYDVAKQVDSVGTRVLVAECNKEIAEAGAMIPDGSHDGVDQNDINPNDVEGHLGSVGMGVLADGCNQKDAEGGTIIPDTSHAQEDQNDSHSSNSGNSPSAAASKEKVPSVQPLVSLAFGQSVPTNLEIQNESIQDHEVQGYPSSLKEISNLRTKNADEEPCLTLSASPAVAEIQSDIPPARNLVLDITSDGQTLPCDSGVSVHPAENHEKSSDHPSLQSRVNMEGHPLVSADTPLSEQQPNLCSADRVDCQPHNPSQRPEAPPQVLEITTQVSSQAATLPGPHLSNVQGSDNHIHWDSRTPPFSFDPLQAELEKLHELKDTVIKCHEAIKLKLKSDYEKELAEMIAQLKLKYEAKRQDAEAAFQLKRKEVDTNLNRVVMNKILAEAFRSKCQYVGPSDPAGIQVGESGRMEHLHQFPLQPSSQHFTGVASSSPAQSSGSQQVSNLQPPLQIVHQSANLFSTTPSRPSSNTNPSSMPTRPPSNINPIAPSSMPSRSPSNVVPISLTSTPSRPPPNINPITPSSTPSRPQPHNINPITPSSRPSRPQPPNINPITPLSTPSRPLPNINPGTPSARNPRVAGEMRAPAPHIRPFRPSTSAPPHDLAAHRPMSSQHASSSLPLSSPTLLQALDQPPLPQSLQASPPFPTNHNGHSTQNSPRSLPAASPLLAQSSSQPPFVLLGTSVLLPVHMAQQADIDTHQSDDEHPYPAVHSAELPARPHSAQAQSADDILIHPLDYTAMLPNNHALNFDEFKGGNQVVLEILRNHPIHDALTLSADLSELYLQEYWSTIAYVTDNGPVPYIQGFVDHYNFRITLKRLRKILNLPTADSRQGRNDFDEPITEDQLCADIVALGYAEPLAKGSHFKRMNLVSVWNTLFAVLNRCLSAITRGVDKSNVEFLRLFHGVAYHRHVDYARILWNGLVSVVQDNEKPGKKRAFIPYPRFLSLAIREAMRSNRRIPRRGNHQTPTEYIMRFLPAHTDAPGVVAMRIPEVLLALACPNAPSVLAYRNLQGLMVPPAPVGPAPRPAQRGQGPRRIEKSVRGAGRSGRGEQRENIERGGTEAGGAEGVASASTTTPQATTPIPTASTTIPPARTTVQHAGPSQPNASTFVPHAGPDYVQERIVRELTLIDILVREEGQPAVSRGHRPQSSPMSVAPASPDHAQSYESAGPDDQFRRMPVGQLRLIDEQIPIPPTLSPTEAIYGAIRRAEGELVENVETLSEREVQKVIESENLATSSRVPTSAIDFHVLGVGIEEDVVDLAVQAQSPPSHSPVSQQMGVSISHGEIPHDLSEPHLEVEDIEIDRTSPHLSISVVHESSLESIHFRTQTEEVTQAVSLSGPAGTTKVAPPQGMSQGPVGSPTRVILTPALNVGHAVDSTAVTTGILSGPGASVDRDSEFTTDELKRMLLTRLTSETNTSQESALVKVLREQVSLQDQMEAGFASLRTSFEDSMKKMVDMYSEISARLTLVEQSCRSQAESSQRKHNRQDDPDDHEGETQGKRQRVEQVEQETGLGSASVEVVVEEAAGTSAQGEQTGKEAEDVSPMVEKPADGDDTPELVISEESADLELSPEKFEEAVVDVNEAVHDLFPVTEHEYQE